MRSGNRKADILLALSLAALIAFVVGVLWLKDVGPTKFEQAKILEMRLSPGAYGDKARVKVETVSGEIRYIAAPPRLMNKCSIGDEVELIRRRFATKVGPRGCSLQE
ncbi:hypothetical protein GCM10023208_10430 [Erythrobacter westpacificensis]|uniref:NusG domain-containing protein n=1 Tax=Erythrobacter westpacificensis TaxID=1055231 RepID=A0ABP9K7E3_9SPHN